MTTHERLQNLVELAKAAGRYVEQGGQRKSDYGKEAYVHLKAHYDTFCEWRHDEPDILHAMAIDERIIAILTAVAYGEMADYEQETACLHCLEQEPYSDDINVQHETDCPVTLARAILREQGTPLSLYKIVYEQAWAGQDNWHDATFLRFAFSEDELRPQFPEEHSRKNRRIRNVRITQVEQAK